MLLLARAVLLGAALAAIGAPAAAQEVAGTPPSLIGRKFAQDYERCHPTEFGDESTHRITFSENHYNTCGGTVCDYEIISHTVVPKGFILKVRSLLLPKEVFRERITVVDEHTIRMGPMQIRYRRCY